MSQVQEILLRNFSNPVFLRMIYGPPSGLRITFPHSTALCLSPSYTSLNHKGNQATGCPSSQRPFTPYHKKHADIAEKAPMSDQRGFEFQLHHL